VILSILDINQKRKKWQIIKRISMYLAISILCIAVNMIYATFGHGVSSDSMTWMFLYPLIGGILYFLLRVIMFFRNSRASRDRVCFNLYNSGIATLTVGSFLKGMMDIAGTSSKFVILYYQIGWLFIASSIILFMIRKYGKRNVVV